MMVSLNLLDLGPLDADDDNNLKLYFVPFGDFSSIHNKQKFVMVGVKGTGKSAVKKHIYEYRTENGRHVIEINDTYGIPISELNSSTPADIKNKMKGYITGLVISYLLQSPHISKPDKEKLGKLSEQSSFFERLKDSVKINAYVEFAISDLFPDKNRSGLLRVIDPSVAETVTEVLNGDDLWILIDDIHTVFTSDDRELTIKFVEGLIYAASDISNKLYNRSVHIVLFLRSEIYDELILKAVELDKELRYIWRVSWGSTELIQFLAERIKWAYKIDKDLKNWKLWTYLFVPKTKRDIEELQKYLLDRVINGPRDLLLLIDGAINLAVSDGANKIDLSHIQESEFSYGDEKLNQINRNFQFVYSDIKTVLDYLFRQENQIYTRSALEVLINDKLLTDKDAREDFQDVRWLRTCTAFSFIKILFQLGFLGYYHPVDKRYVYSLEKANPDRALVRSDSFRIHSAFTNYLELKEK